MTAYPGPGTAPLTIPTGYANAPGFTSLTTWPGGSPASNTTYSFFDFPAGMGFSNAASTANITFIGCRFRSNSVAGANVQGPTAGGITATNIRFIYCTFQPSAVSAPPVAYGSGYQYGINQAGIQGMTVDHSDFWGFGNGIQLSTMTQALPVTVSNSFFHDPSADGGGIYHVDGILSNDGVANAYLNVTGNTIAGVGNTNALALQFAATAYSHVNVTGNYFSGYGYMCNVGGASASTSIVFANNVWGADFEPVFGPLYGPTFTAQPGSYWYGNTIFWPSASPLLGASTAWMASGNSGLFWWPSDANPPNGSAIIGHAADFASPPAGISITAGEPSAIEVMLQIVVLNNAKEAGGAALPFFAANAAFTPNGTNSFLAWCQSNFSTATIAAAEPSNTYLAALAGSVGNSYLAGYFSGGVAAGVPVTIGNTGTFACESAAYEILAAGAVTPGIDASTPAAAQPFRTSSATVSFAPPPGAVLVALLSAYDTAATVAPTISGGGVTWTQRVIENQFSSGLAVLWTATVPAGGGPSATPARAADFDAGGLLRKPVLW